MVQGGGREGELLKKMKENLNFGQKLAIFFNGTNIFLKFGETLKNCNFLPLGRG